MNNNLEIIVFKIDLLAVNKFITFFKYFLFLSKYTTYLFYDCLLYIFYTRYISFVTDLENTKNLLYYLI